MGFIKKVFHLPPQNELRFLVPQSTTTPPLVYVTVGCAEINGLELPSSPLNTSLPPPTDPSNPPIPSSVPTIIPPGSKLSIFTWYGCELMVVYHSSLEELGYDMYTSDETGMIAAINIHSQLEAMRESCASGLESTSTSPSPSTSASASASKQSPPPRVLVLGDADSGKTTLCKILTSYATKLGRKPILVDLDPTRGSIYPSTIGVSRCGFKHSNVQTLTQGEFHVGGQDVFSSTGGRSSNDGGSLVYYFGRKTVDEKSEKFFNELVNHMGEVVRERIVESGGNGALGGGSSGTNNEFSSGVIVNFIGEVKVTSPAYLSSIQTAIKAFNVNVVLVVDHPRLFNKLAPIVGSSATVVKVAKPSGVEKRDGEFRRREKFTRFKEVLYGYSFDGEGLLKSIKDGESGENNNEDSMMVDGENSGGAAGVGHALKPMNWTKPYESLFFYNLETVDVADTMLPVGHQQVSESITLRQIPLEELHSKFSHAICAVCQPEAVLKYNESGRGADLTMSAVAGLVTISAVNVETGRVSLLSPVGEELPSLVFLVGDGAQTFVE